MTEYWIPYMWSKRALAKDIIHFIRQHNPKAKYLYDIFWGGSVSFEALQQGFEKVYYVDLDKWMCNLMEQIKKGIPKEWNKRVSSKEFEELKIEMMPTQYVCQLCGRLGIIEMDTYTHLI